MAAKGKGAFQSKGQSNLRARFHDFNSQRRNRNLKTTNWENYKKVTGNGRKQFTKS